MQGADVVYTDSFISMGMEHEKDIRIKAFLPKYQVNSELFNKASDEAIFMHCLPATRGQEVDAVIDTKQSVVFDQAENRLHTQKAVMLKLLNKI